MHLKLVLKSHNKIFVAIFKRGSEVIDHPKTRTTFCIPINQPIRQSPGFLERTDLASGFVECQDVEQQNVAASGASGRRKIKQREFIIVIIVIIVVFIVTVTF
jgi:hypothetical protein